MAADGAVTIEINGDDKGFRKSLGSLNSVAQSALRGIAVGIGGATAAAGVAMVALGKQAISAYADYEQLTGGVETLFQDSAPVIAEYAAKAFKTAGISANAYMETVTSFSASLLQSLGGDTKAAANSADMAITDMADNANKMGTDMGTIQMAYQGFAKQNYTMLDNLKLGYGGTKEEMARLLADAQKLSGQKYDLRNLNDVYEAVHIVQSELGITGTTAKEASTTIQGSAASMQSAWGNLLVGMSDDTIDFNSLLENFIDSIGTFAQNLLPRIQIVLGGIVKLASGLGPQLAAMLLGLMTELMPQVIAVAFQLIQGFVQGIWEHRAEIVTAAAGIMTALLEGLGDIVPILAPVTNGLSVLVAHMQELTPVVAGATAAVLAYKAAMGIVALIEGVQKAVTAFKTANEATTISQGLLNAVMNANPFVLITALVAGVVAAIITLYKTNEDFRNKVQAVWAAVTTTFQLAVTAIKEAVSTLFSTIVNGLSSLPGKVFDIGEQVVSGLIQGLTAGVKAVGAAIGNIAAGIVGKFKALLGIHSPSKVFAQLGCYTMEGFRIGMQTASGKVIQTAGDLSAEILDAASSWVEKKQFYNDLAAENELQFWQALCTMSGLQAKELASIEQKIYTAKAAVAKKSYEDSKNWIDRETFYNRLSAQEEIHAWERVAARKNLLAADQLEAERYLYTARQTLLNQQKSAYNEYLDTLAARAEGLSSFTGIFDQVAQDSKTSGTQLLENLRGQVQAFEAWQFDITQLANRGISGPLLAELQDLGPKAAAEIRALTTLTDEELQEYAGLFAEKARLGTEQAKREIPPVAIPLELGVMSVQQIQTAVLGGITAVCAAVSDAAALLTAQTGQVAAAMCDTVLAKQDDFYRVGAESMDGLNDGLWVHGQKAIATARSIAARIISSMQSVLDIHSPSRKMRDLVGVPSAKGLMIGFEEGLAGWGHKMQAAVDGEIGKVSLSAAVLAEEKRAANNGTKEIHNTMKTVEKVARIEGDGITGELVRLLGLRLKTETNRVGASFV